MKDKLFGVSLNNSLEACIYFLRSKLHLVMNYHDNDSEPSSLTEARKNLHTIIQRTAAFGESNSVLLTGPVGSGKTSVIRNVLQDLNEDKAIIDNLLIVQMNGLLQTDDNIALKEITRQLQLENAVDDKVFGSFSETLQFLLDSLKSGGHAAKSVLFILEEFDLFAHHKNQTLLYNLFDVSQSAQTPVCIIGITCRLDVVELLEKRVKSRFSHRHIHLFSRPTFDDYTKMFVNLLSLSSSFPDTRFAKSWNKDILALSKEPVVTDILKRQYDSSKELCGLQKLIIYPISQLSHSHPKISSSDFIEGAKIINLDSKSAILRGLSVLELCLVIAMKHLTETYDSEPFNFEMVYNEYYKFTRHKSSIQHFERNVVLKAFEHLLALEIVRPIDSVAQKVQKEYRLMMSLVYPSQIHDLLLMYPNCPTDVKQWACSSLCL